jgi:glycerophosphoryl diester phosphodiesterase
VPRLFGLSTVLFLLADGAVLSGGGVSDSLVGARPIRYGPPPAAYDCTAPANGPPRRGSSRPLGCILDPGCSATLVASHRGAGVDSLALVSGLYLRVGGFAPENTLPAIRWAIVAGADLVELDVRTSADGHLVLMHDDDVTRTTLGRGRVSRLTLAELRKLSLRTAQFRGDFHCARVPTFEEALELARGRINLHVDLKAADARAVARAAQRAGMLDQVFLLGHAVELAWARAAVPGVQVVPRVGRDPHKIPRLLAAFSPKVLEVNTAILTPERRAAIHAAGAKIMVDGFHHDVVGYLTGRPEAYASLLDKGPDIVQVDRAELLLELLRRR